ncbi:MAG: phosphoribosylformimino-5-aminoimidazole carboxamide ribotide isomerase [Rubripirellula sp.]
MTKFRPCIDLHHGQVKQIVGGTLTDAEDAPIENFVAQQSAGWFARKYAGDDLTGGHVIKLGPGNEEAARESLAAYPGGLQIGGGIHAENARDWLDAGASHVIVTSWLFNESGELIQERLEKLVSAVGRNRIVLDLSCRRLKTSGSKPCWRIAMNRWQTITNVEIKFSTLDHLAQYSSEFLIHAADVEGLCQGIDSDLVEFLGRWAGLPMTYAGGVGSFADVQAVASASDGKVDVTVGSALDLFGGSGVTYDELVRWNERDRIQES